MKAIYRRLIVFIAVFFASGIFGTSSYALKVNIDTARVEISVKPGEEKSGFVTVQNYDETGSVHMKAYVQDLVYLPDGSNDFLPIGSTPWSLGDHIKVGPTEFDLAPGKQEVVRYVLSLPSETKGGRYGVIFFEVAMPPSQFERVGASMNVRLGTILLVTVENTEIVKAKLKGVNVTKPRVDVPLTVSCVVYNEGNVLARPVGDVKIINDQKEEAAAFPINKDKGGVLPQTSRTFSAEYKNKEPLKKGTYYAQVVLDYGGEAYLGGQTKFVID